VNLSEEDWDAVINVHLKGHFIPTRHAAAYWREQAKAGTTVKASIISTSSTSGLIGNVGQSNYCAAKAGIAAFTVIIAEELARYGVRANAIAPVARTRMTEALPGLGDHIAKPTDASVFDAFDPGNISPLVATLAMQDCEANGQVFFVQGGTVRKFQNWTMTTTIEKNDRWDVAELAKQLPTLLA
jgi:NAD(P)-dependent dehydrogenase (short-subunit alcohol dehydrogenase family)